MDKIIPLLEKLAVSLNTTSEKLLEVIIKQAKISFFCTTIQYLIVLFSVFINVKLYRLCVKENWEPPYTPAFIILFIINIFSVLVGFISIENYIASILNPEYWALQKILSKIFVLTN